MPAESSDKRMRPLFAPRFFTCVLATGLTLLCWSYSGPANAVEPNAKTTVIRVGDKAWALSDLNQVALAALREKSADLDTNRCQAVVYILPRDKDIMCEFTFSQGFDRPYWRVTFDYQGRVKTCVKKLRKEG